MPPQARARCDKALIWSFRHKACIPRQPRYLAGLRVQSIRKQGFKGLGFRGLGYSLHNVVQYLVHLPQGCVSKATQTNMEPHLGLANTSAPEYYVLVRCEVQNVSLVAGKC